jgi:hypothetical protein
MFWKADKITLFEKINKHYYSLNYNVKLIHVWEIESPIQWVAGALSLEVKRPGRDVAIHLHLVPRSNNASNYTLIPPIRLHGVVHRDNFTYCTIKASSHHILHSI